MSARATPTDVAVAELIVRGDGSPRMRVQLVAEVAQSLATARDEGERAGRAAERIASLRESKAILEGIAQDAAGRIRVVDREIADREAAARRK